MRTTQTTRLSQSIDKIDPAAIGMTAEHWFGRRGLRQILLQLQDGPLDTRTLHEKIGGATEPLRERLREGVRAGIIAQRRRYKGIPGQRSSQLPALWELDPAGIRRAAVKKPTSNWPIDELPKKLQRIIHEADWGSRGVTNHHAWWIGNLIAIVHVNPVATNLAIKTRLGVDYATVRSIVKRAETAGAVKVHRPMRRGVIGRPVNRYEPLFDEIATWRNPAFDGRRLAPERSLMTLGQLMVKRDRRTPEQRRICDATVWQETGLTKSAYWDDARVLLALIGTSRITTNEKLAAELGCGVQAIEKTVRRLKRAGLLAKKLNAGGERGRESEYVPAWDIVGQIAGKHLSTNRHQAPKKRAAASPATTGRPREWDHICDWVAQHRQEYGTLAKTREVYRVTFPDKPLPTLPRLKSAMHRRKTTPK
jgi:predicted transcriptional regulator